MSNVIAISAGGYHGLALRSNGTVIAWGNNGNEQTNVPLGLSNAVRIAAGEYHSLALKSDGTVVGWGNNNSGQTNIPSGLSNVIAIAAGGNDYSLPRGFNLALKSNDTVVAWGDNSSGQTNVPAGLNHVIGIAAGGSHGMALRDDGSVIAWGSLSYVPSGIRNIGAIAGGEGRLASWGLAVMADLRIVSIVLSNQSAILTFHTSFGQQYAVEYSADLNSDNWTNLPGGNVAGSGQDALVTDNNSVADSTNRFYRVRRW